MKTYKGKLTKEGARRLSAPQLAGKVVQFNIVRLPWGDFAYDIKYKGRPIGSNPSMKDGIEL